MKKNIYEIFLLALIAVAVSCSSSKGNLAYFENADSLLISGATIGDNNFGLMLVPEDELKIIIHSEIPEATGMYNLSSMQTYIVDKKGYIDFPIIGKLFVMGKSVEEVQSLISNEVLKHVKNPYVYVKLWNFRVNVLGEVNAPGVKWANKERYSILDAIGDAGDLTQYGRRDNVMLIREENGTKHIYRFNLNDVKLLESPNFYLRQNDVIVVEPNNIKKENYYAK